MFTFMHWYECDRLAAKEGNIISVGETVNRTCYRHNCGVCVLEEHQQVTPSISSE